MKPVDTSAFKRDAAALLARLEPALEETRKARVTIEIDTARLSLERKKLLRGYAKKLLPDFSIDTISILSQVVPTFWNPSVAASVRDFRNLKVPFWTWISGKKATYLANAERDVLELLRVRMLGILYSADLKEGILGSDLSALGVGELDQKIVALQAKDNDLARTQEYLEQQISALQHSLAADTVPPKQFAKAVSASARKVEDQPSTTNNDFETLMTLLIAHQLLESTFSYSPSGEVAYQDNFQGGGGGMGGGGATGTWEQAPAPAEQSPSSFDEASIAGLGAIS